MRAESNLLSRHSHFSSGSALSTGQLSLDSTLQHFTEQASDPYALAAVFAGGTAFRAVRGLGFSTLGTLVGESRVGAALLRTGVNAAGLAAESGTFVSSERLLRVAFGGADQSLLRWEGTNGLKNAWASAAVNFTALRGAGHVMGTQNGVLQHVGAVTAMVGANHASAKLGFTEVPQGSLAEQIVQASVLDLQMRGSMALLHSIAPGLVRWERSVDVAHEIQSASLGRGHAFENLFPHSELLPLMGAEGSAERKAERKAAKAQARFERSLNSFGEDVRTDHRLEESSKTRIFVTLGEEGARTPETLARAKEVRDEILSNTVPDKEKLAFAEMRHLVPNGISVIAGICGVFSMFAAHEGHLNAAAWYLVAAAVFDKADGGVARLKIWTQRRRDGSVERNADGSVKKVDSRHPIGELLDSFVDVCCYGMASGYFAYSVLSELKIPEVGVVVGTVIAVNAILRLATFEFLGSEKGKKFLPPRDILHNPVHGNGNGFIGRPSTMTGPELAALWMATGLDHALLHKHPLIYMAGALISGVAMYAPLAYDKLTDGRLGGFLRSKLFLGSTATVIGASIYQGDPQILGIYSLAGMAYYLSSPFLKAGKRVYSRRFGSRNQERSGVRVEARDPAAEAGTDASKGEAEAEVSAAVMSLRGHGDGEG